MPASYFLKHHTEVPIICLPRFFPFIFYSNHAQNPVLHKSSAPSDVASLHGVWVIEEGEWRTLLPLEGLKLMCPFGFSEGDLKNKKCSVSGLVTVPLLINVNPPPKSPLHNSDFCTSIPSVQAGRENATHSDSMHSVKNWVSVLCMTTVCQIVRQSWWREESY